LCSIQKNASRPINDDKNEIEQFFGCIIYMSIYGLASSRMYWKSMTRASVVAERMSCNRWKQIKLRLHFNDNTYLNPSDKLYKIRSILQPLTENFRKIRMSEKLSVDEQVILVKGKHSLKNYVNNKPKNWGYKAFVLCDSNGIAHNLKLYSGKAVHGPSLPDVGVSGNVLRLASVIPRNMFHKLYFDNWFTGVQLVSKLEKLGIHSLGTVRPNQLKGCKFSCDKEMKKRG
jgi:hypothetical protein